MSPIRFAVITSLAFITIAAVAQEDRGLITQTLVHADSKADILPDIAAIKLEVNSKITPLTSLIAVKPSGVQIALLIDDGLSRSAGIQLGDLRTFATSLPPETELLVGYMSNGHAQVEAPFSTNHQAAAAKIRMSMGQQGQAASPYFCLSDFVKEWTAEPGQPGQPVKARFVIMLTSGVDPYNGSTRMSNQDSPYVEAAIADAQRAGVAVYSIYYGGEGMRGDSAAMSGQGYLSKVADETGGDSYYQGSGNPISLSPFLKQFTHAISETYIATFSTDPIAAGRDHLLRLKMSTSTPKLKLRTANEVRPGNREVPGAH